VEWAAPALKRLAARNGTLRSAWKGINEGTWVWYSIVGWTHTRRAIPVNVGVYIGVENRNIDSVMNIRGELQDMFSPE
jgi:argininosuccinate lyase